MLRRRALFGAGLLVLSAPVCGHEDARAAVRVILDGVEPAIAGLRVQVYDDELAPQIVLENGTGRVLEILDDGGRAFVRVGDRGVEADLAAAAWYDTLSPGGVAAPPRARDAQAPAEWRRVRAQPSWGWFDRRLDKNQFEAPDAHEPVVLGRWRVPARLGGAALEIHGHFLYQAQPGGAFLPRLTSGPEIAPKVRVTLAPGQPPALLLENTGAEPAVVLGRRDEPFLRISHDGVEANLASPTWQDLGRYRGLADPAALGGDDAGPHWQRVSLAPRYSWLEPRAGMPSAGFPAAARAADNTRSKAKAWQVPVLIGQRRLAIQGVVEWVPFRAAETAVH